MTNRQSFSEGKMSTRSSDAVDLVGRSLGLADYRSSLAAELLADIEGYRLPAEGLLFKARRLAQVAGDRDIEDWLSAELSGYPAVVPDGLAAWLERVGRIRRVKRAALPVHNIAAELLASIEGTRPAPPPSPPSDYMTITYKESLPRIEESVLPSMGQAIEHNSRTTAAVARRQQVPGAGTKIDTAKWEEGLNRSRQDALHLAEVARKVRAELHRYVSATYHRFAFTEIASAIFDRHKVAVDELLRATAEDVIDKIPSIYERLAQGDPEAISQAMSSSRRMIAVFADVVCPPRAEPAQDEDGGTHKLTKQEVLNRITQYMRENCPSDSRVERLGRTLRLIHDRVSAGMKNDITAEEAQSLFLLTYLTLGEIVAASREAKAPRMIA
jgi:hypothetical protein